MQKQYKLTEERLIELKEEYEYLTTVREKEVADQIKEARSFGDLSENSEYDEAKNEQGKLYSRIAELEKILETGRRDLRRKQCRHRLHRESALRRDQTEQHLRHRRLPGGRSDEQLHLR